MGKCIGFADIGARDPGGMVNMGLLPDICITGITNPSVYNLTVAIFEFQP